MFLCRTAAIAALTVIAVFPTAAQAPESSAPVFSTQTRAIQINVVVKDATGHLLSG